MFVDFNGNYAPPVDMAHLSDITSPFGKRKDPFTGKETFHDGTDFAWGGCLGANIYAVAGGKITKAKDTGDGYGLTIIVEHDNGWITLYGHCSAAYVKVGDIVEAGQLIAAIGSSGRSTGSHVHVGLKIGGSWHDVMQLY
jgi:murein DD-endopeptidase MepM/ murein hydrolase activator NlpD